MHPISPQLEDQVLDDPKFNTARGKRENLFKAFVDVTDKFGEGFVDYVWDKPTQKGIIELLFITKKVAPFWYNFI